MQREWDRPVVAEGNGQSDEPSAKLVLVILFWTLFEHLMDGFFHAAVYPLPPGVGQDLLQRYGFVGARMDQLYPKLFGVTLEGDLKTLGHSSTYEHIRKVQDRRNEFIHENPNAIDDTLVAETVAKLHDVQEAVVALFNLRCAGNPKAPPMWREPKREKKNNHQSKR